MARRSRRSSNAPDPEDYLPEEEPEVDEEEDERPRRRRRPRDEDDEDERPRRRRPRDEEDEDEDEDEEEEERPRRRRSRDEDADEPPRRRRSRDDEDDEDEDEDEDEEPRRTRGKKSKKRGSNRNSGWGGYDNVKSRSSSYASKLMVSKLRGESLIKFLEDEPFGSYGLHWFDELSGKKGWMCLDSVGKEKCPGCDLGDRPTPNALFNVLELDDDGDWVPKVIAAGTRLTGQLQGLADGKGGLSGPYWSVMAGPKGSGTGNFQKVKERDLEEDWDVDPLSRAELEDFREDSHVLEDVEMIPSYADFADALKDID